MAATVERLRPGMHRPGVERRLYRDGLASGNVHHGLVALTTAQAAHRPVRVRASNV